jgi:hypothetical protein
VKSVPRDQRIEQPYGVASAKYSYTGSTANYELGFSQAVYQMKAELYPAWVQHWQAVTAAFSQPIVFEKP